MSVPRNYVTAPDGTTVYVTVDGDVVDDIAQAYYGEHARNTEAVYEANPGLSLLGPVLSAGVTIRLPAKSTQPEAKPYRRLWD